MAWKPEIQYVRYSVDGSTARKIEEPARKKKAAPQPRPRRKREPCILIDPLTIAGILMAAVMLVLIAVGFVQWQAAEQQQAQMEAYVASLQDSNRELQAQFDQVYDEEALREAAQALGLVPADSLEQTPIQVSRPAPPAPEPTLWEQITQFFQELFA